MFVGSDATDRKCNDEDDDCADNVDGTVSHADG